MISDETPASSGLEPTASLTSVRVRRRKSSVAPTGKPGDLTVSSAAEAPAPTAAIPTETIIVLPPPPEPEPSEELRLLLPLLEVSRELPREPVTIIESEMEAPAPLEAEPEQPELPLVAATTEPERDVESELDASELNAEPEADAAPEDAALEPAVEAPTPIVEVAAEPAPPSRVESTADEVIDYWDSLRGGREFPALDELNRSLVAASWPNTVLLGFAAPETPSITRIGAGNGEIEYTAMVTDWILSRGRQSAKRARPLDEEQRFPVSDGTARYRLLLLPFSSYGLNCDHVLCHLSRLQDLGAVASFKRWFTR